MIEPGGDQPSARWDDDLLQQAVHDLVSPLTAVVGYVNLVRHDLELGRPVEAGDHASSAAAACERLRDRLDRLGELRSLRTGSLRVRPVEVVLKPIVERAVVGAGIDAARVRVMVPDTVSVRADPQALRRVLVELLSNAAAASTPGDPIVVIARASSGQVRVEVVDRGRGLDGGLRDLLLAEPERSPGMALVSAYVRAMGGAIDITGEAGAGTTVSVRVPQAGRTSGSSDPAP